MPKGKEAKWRKRSEWERRYQIRLGGERRGAVNDIVRKDRLRKEYVGVWKNSLSCVFKDVCFPPKCKDRIKIETSDIKLTVAQIVFYLFIYFIRLFFSFEYYYYFQRPSAKYCTAPSPGAMLWALPTVDQM